MRGAQALIGAPRAIGWSSGAPRLALACAARVRAFSLDRRLAAGMAPWQSPLLAARALQLTGERHRRSLATALERLPERAERPASRALSAVVPVCREQVCEALPAILSLAEQLRGGSPVDARGIARLAALLADGAGPVYVAHCPGALCGALQDVRDGLSVND